MQTFRAKSVQTVQAIRLRQEIQIGKVTGQPGDYLELTSTGWLLVHRAEDFARLFDTEGDNGLTKERDLLRKVYTGASIPSVPTMNETVPTRAPVPQIESATPRKTSVFSRKPNPETLHRIVQQTVQKSQPDSMIERIATLLRSSGDRELTTKEIARLLDYDANSVSAQTIVLFRQGRVLRRRDPNNPLAFLYKAVGSSAEPKSNNPRTVCLTDQIVNLIREYGEMTYTDIVQFLPNEKKESVASTLSQLTSRNRINRLMPLGAPYVYSLPKTEAKAETERVA